MARDVPPSHDPTPPPPSPPPAQEPPATHHNPIHHNPPPAPPGDPPGYHDAPGAPPPSYDDATNPLLGGIPPAYTYGTWQEPDDSSSTAATEIETTDYALHEWIGHFVVISFFVAIIYGFWMILDNPPDPMNHFPGYGPDGRHRSG